MKSTSLLHARGVGFDAPGGRPLFRDLTIAIAPGERVALVGRNGVGKSSLLAVLAGQLVPNTGQVLCRGSRVLVPQQLPAPNDVVAGGQLSPGELRRRVLLEACDSRPDLLLLDEPTHDLDDDGIGWLVDWLTSWRGSVLVVSHDRRVLRLFHEFFLVAESGCRHFSGSFAALGSHLAREGEQRQERYVRNLGQLLDKEQRSATDRRRRQRKKNLGRLHELKRCPSSLKLNDKRSYAQEKQGKRAVRREARLNAAREWTRAMRRALSVDLPLQIALSPLPEQVGPPIVVLDEVGMSIGSRILFGGISLRLGRDRLAITGPNGSGKTTLVEILAGERPPTEGRAMCDVSRIGYVAQNSSNWCRDESVIDHLLQHSAAVSIETAAQLLRAHKFPSALAARPLRSLSPGERLRAALICLLQRRPTPELLVLDEPTNHLDFVGLAALESVLAAWTGGLVVVAHDQEFLQAINVERRLNLDALRLSSSLAPSRARAMPDGECS